MNAPQDILANLSFYISQPHDCGYFENREAATLFTDPQATIGTAEYTQLSRYGFRRSGDMFYRPRCPDCNACIPVRLPVAEFKPNRSQQRLWRKNNDLSADIKPAEFSEEHYHLYQRYMSRVHPGGSMETSSAEQYMSFLTARHIETHFVEFRHVEKLVAVAVTDVLNDGFSAVYTYYDPDETSRSLGTNAIMWQVRQALQQDLKWLYLGYWIKDCRKMSYKTNFRPIQALLVNSWKYL